MTERGNPESRPFAWATLAVLSIGVLLRLGQWASSPAFFLDEVGLAENVVSGGLVGLAAHPLNYGQVAPIGFLLTAKTLSKIFGQGEMALRLLPMLGSILSLVLFWLLVRKFLGSVGTFTAVLLVALNPLLISLAGVFKQYATDVMVSVLLLWATLFFLQERRSGFVSALVGGAAGVLAFFSIPSILVAGPAIGTIALHTWRSYGYDRGSWIKRTALPVSLWGIVTVLASLHAKRLADYWYDRLMRDFWTQRGGFLPSFLEAPREVLDNLTGTLTPGLFFRPYLGRGGGQGSLVDGPVLSWLLIVLAVGGMVSLLVRGRGVGRLGWALLGLGPLSLTVLLSRLSVYPLNPKTSVFLLPLLVFLMARAADDLADHRLWTRIRPGVVLPILLMLPLCKILLDGPRERSLLPTRELFSELADRREPGAPVVGFWWSRPFLEYYGRRIGLEAGSSLSLAQDLKTNLEELALLEGQRRVWLIFPHSYGVERDILLCYSKMVGRETDQVALYGPTWPSPVSLHGFDFSDPDRWDRVNPSEFPLDPAAYSRSLPRCPMGNASVDWPGRG